jgi:hypothetical protein
MLVLVLVDDVAVHVMMHGESNTVLAISTPTICVLPPAFSLAHLIFEIPKETTMMVTTGPRSGTSVLAVMGISGYQRGSLSQKDIYICMCDNWVFFSIL